MAKRTVTMVLDDLDNSSKADETITFALDGVTYEIDLTAANAARLRDDFGTWVGHAQPIAGRRRRRGGTGVKKDLGQVRNWARSQGYAVSDRGRISGEIQAAYDKAHA